MYLSRRFTFPVAIITSLFLAMLLYWISGQLDYTQVVWAAASDKDFSAKQDRDVTSNLASKPIIENKESASSSTESNCQVSEKYPDRIRIWCSLITQHAEQKVLDPDLIAALIWQESGGNPSAYSHSGAVGLMQVMPRDGIAASFRCPNGPCFKNRPSIAQLEDPEFNVSYGTKMLAGLVKQRGGLREALKSYGPADVGYSYADKVIKIYKQYKD